MDTGATDLNKKKLYGEQTELTLENMSFSGKTLSMFPDYISSAAKVKKACADANCLAGLLSEDKKNKISAACDLLIKGEYVDQFPVDVYHGGGGIGINMNLNEVIASLAGDDVHAVNDVNLSQSTSDVCHTALRLTLYDKLTSLDGLLDDFINELKHKQEEFKDIDTIARTCWQDGVRISEGAIFEGTGEALRRQKKEIKFWNDTLRHINLGWTVVGNGSGADEKYRTFILTSLSKTIGREVTWCKSPYGSAEYPDDIAGISGFVSRTAQMLAKFARDTRILSSGPETGLKEWIVPAVQAGSSFFPGKTNPVMAEMMIQCAALIEGHNTVIQNALGQGEIHLNVWEEMMGFLLLNSMQMFEKATRLFLDKCVSGIEVDKKICERYAHSRIPLIAEAKEKYGYEYLSEKVHEEGFKALAAELREEMREKMKENREEMREKIKENREGMKEKIKENREEMKGKIKRRSKDE